MSLSLFHFFSHFSEQRIDFVFRLCLIYMRGKIFSIFPLSLKKTIKAQPTWMKDYIV